MHSMCENINKRNIGPKMMLQCVYHFYFQLSLINNGYAACADADVKFGWSSILTDCRNRVEIPLVGCRSVSLFIRG